MCVNPGVISEQIRASGTQWIHWVWVSDCPFCWGLPVLGIKYRCGVSDLCPNCKDYIYVLGQNKRVELLKIVFWGGGAGKMV